MDANPGDDAPWRSFDSDDYFRRNYLSVREDDRAIVGIVRDFFARTAGGSCDLRGIDVGTGPNLYPALAMLPFCDQVDLYEYSSQNIEWLESGRDTEWVSIADTIHAFWEIYTCHPVYGSFSAQEGPCTSLSRRTRIVKGSVFDLNPAQDELYDIGTMFFVAESLSQQRRDFELALRCFLDALRPGAPFAAAFMEGSLRYQIGGIYFPAVPVTADDVRHALTAAGAQAHVERIPIPAGGRLRPDYDGMLVAVGHAAS